jgi:hypothetical protein
MEAAFRVKFLVQTDIDIVETIGTLIDKAKACRAALEPTNRVQFDQELKLGRETCRLLLSIKNEVYSQKTYSRPLQDVSKDIPLIRHF